MDTETATGVFRCADEPDHLTRKRPCELAWLWLRHQPTSALSVWFQERVRSNGGKMRKTTIVALARKLLVALWKYSTSGVVIEGAVMKAI